MTIGSRFNQPPTVMMPAAGFVRETPGGRPAHFSSESLKITAGKMFAAESVDSAVAGDLRRDDELGVLCAGAFNLPVPEMPEELKG